MHYSATYARKLRHKNFPNSESKNSAGLPLWLRKFIFDFLYTQENENDTSNENSQRVEKEKRFSDLTEEQKIKLFVDVESKATKSSNQRVVKVFKGIRRNTNKHIIDYKKLKETLEI